MRGLDSCRLNVWDYLSSLGSCKPFSLSRVSLFGYGLLLLGERPSFGGGDAQLPEGLYKFLSLRGASKLHHFLVHVIQVLLLWTKD